MVSLQRQHARQEAVKGCNDLKQFRKKPHLFQQVKDDTK